MRSFSKKALALILALAFILPSAIVSYATDEEAYYQNDSSSNVIDNAVLNDYGFKISAESLDGYSETNGDVSNSPFGKVYMDSFTYQEPLYIASNNKNYIEASADSKVDVAANGFDYEEISILSNGFINIDTNEKINTMDVSNASVYDGATAAAEAAAMCRDRKRKVTLVSATTNPEVINTIRTYCYGTGDEMKIVPAKDGKTDMAALKEMLAADTASFYVQQPNFFGQFEEAEELGKLVHEAGAMYVMGCNPIALAIMKSPAECGADVAVGEAQPLGMPLSYGGPYLGYMATLNKHLRKLPGRIVGETVDTEGRRAFCLALQAREQHIRREKASSNICSNQALCALTAGVYVSAMGPVGMTQAAKQSMAKAHYLANELCKIPGVSLKFTGEYFHEFVTEMPKADEVLKALENADILGGLKIEEGVLWCATEKVTKADLDKAVAIVKEVCA